MRTFGQNKMGVKPIGSLLFSMGLPVMISMMIQALYNVVDSIFIARVGEKALTAISLVFPIQILMISIGVGTSIGVNAILSRRLGEKRYEDASNIAMHGLFLALLIWILFAIFGGVLSQFFFSWFTDDPEIIAMGTSYMFICTTLSLGIFGQLIIERIMQGTGNTIHPMIVQTSGAIINIVLDPILIFGLFGFPALGVTGAAIATVIGQMSALCLGLFFMLRKTKEISFRFTGFRLRLSPIQEIYQVGLPSIIMQSIGTLMTIGMNAILISFSATAVAVFGVYFRLQSFVFMPIFGLTTAMISIVAFNFGAKNRERITKTITLTLIVAISLLFLGSLIFQLFPRPLLRMFDASEEMILIGIRALRVISVNFAFAGVGIVLSSSFQALGKGTYSLLLSCTRQLVFLLPAAFILSRLWGLNAVWFCFMVSEGASLIMSIVLYRRVYKKLIEPIGIPQVR